MELQQDGKYDKYVGTKLWLGKLNVRYDLIDLRVEGVIINLDH